MTCRLIENRLDDYLDSALDAEQRIQVESHAAECADCRRRLERAQSLGALLRKLPVEGPADGFFDQALAAAEDASGKRSSGRFRRRYWLGAVAAGILVAASLTVLIPDLPTPDGPSGLARIALAVEETRTVNLVFASDIPLDDVSLVVELPDGIELAMYPGRDRIEWATRLQSGRNVLPLELVATGGNGGELVATLRGDDREKVFRIDIAVLTGERPA